MKVVLGYEKILGSFSFPPNALILALGVTFSFREIKSRDGCFHDAWPLVSFWLGGGQNAVSSYTGQVGLHRGDST